MGDILTIKLQEEVTLARKSDDAINANQKQQHECFRAQVSWALLYPHLTGNDAKTELAAKRTFTGQGKAGQSNSLEGDISVTVAEVLPNGNLKVRGEKQVTLKSG